MAITQTARTRMRGDEQQGALPGSAVAATIKEGWVGLVVWGGGDFFFIADGKTLILHFHQRRADEVRAF